MKAHWSAMMEAVEARRDQKSAEAEIINVVEISKLKASPYLVNRLQLAQQRHLMDQDGGVLMKSWESHARALLKDRPEVHRTLARPAVPGNAGVDWLLNDALQLALDEHLQPKHLPVNDAATLGMLNDNAVATLQTQVKVAKGWGSKDTNTLEQLQETAASAKAKEQQLKLDKLEQGSDPLKHTAQEMIEMRRLHDTLASGVMHGRFVIHKAKEESAEKLEKAFQQLSKDIGEPGPEQAPLRQIKVEAEQAQEQARALAGKARSPGFEAEHARLSALHDSLRWSAIDLAPPTEPGPTLKGKQEAMLKSLYDVNQGRRVYVQTWNAGDRETMDRLNAFLSDVKSASVFAGEADFEKQYEELLARDQQLGADAMTSMGGGAKKLKSDPQLLAALGEKQYPQARARKQAMEGLQASLDELYGAIEKSGGKSEVVSAKLEQINRLDARLKALSKDKEASDFDSRLNNLKGLLEIAWIEAKEALPPGSIPDKAQEAAPGKAQDS